MIFRIHLYYMPLVYKEYIQSSQNAVYISIYFNPVSIDSTEKALTAKANSPQMPKRPTRCKHECPHLQSCSSLLSPFRQKNSAHGLSVYHSLSIPCTLQKIRASFEGLAKHVWSVKMEAEGDYSWRLVQLWLHGISAGCVGSIGRFWPARKHEEGSSTLKYHLPSLPKPKDAKPTKNTKNINNRSSNYSAWRAWANEIYWLLSNWIQEHFHAFSEDFCVCRGGSHLMLSNAVISTSPPPTPPLGTAAAPGWGPRLLESKQLGRNFICCSSLTSWASCAWAVLLAKFIEWWCNTDYNQAFQETLHMFLPKKTVYVSMFGASSTSTSQFSFLFSMAWPNNTS